MKHPVKPVRPFFEKSAALRQPIPITKVKFRPKHGKKDYSDAIRQREKDLAIEVGRSAQWKRRKYDTVR